MDQRWTCIEHFGDTDLGDGFESGVGVAPGADEFTVCVALRFGSLDLTDANLAYPNQWICGNFDAAGATEGWGLRLGQLQFFPGFYTLVVQSAAGEAGIIFSDLIPEPWTRVSVLHVGFYADNLRLWFNGQETLSTEPTGNPTVPRAGGRFSIGYGADMPAGYQPFGASEHWPSQHNGVLGVAYGEFAASSELVDEHWRQMLEGNDLVDGVDDNGDMLPWNHLWSARRGFASGDDELALWRDSYADADLTRVAAIGQEPVVHAASRRPRQQ